MKEGIDENHPWVTDDDKIWTSENESQRWITHGNGLHGCWIIKVLLYILLNYLSIYICQFPHIYFIL